MNTSCNSNTVFHKLGGIQEKLLRYSTIQNIEGKIWVKELKAIYGLENLGQPNDLDISMVF
jgi:hypothetical protein